MLVACEDGLNTKRYVVEAVLIMKFIRGVEYEECACWWIGERVIGAKFEYE